MANNFLVVEFTDGRRLEYPLGDQLELGKEAVKRFYEALGPFRPVHHDLGVFREDAVNAVYLATVPDPKPTPPPPEPVVRGPKAKPETHISLSKTVEQFIKRLGG